MNHVGDTLLNLWSIRSKWMIKSTWSRDPNCMHMQVHSANWEQDREGELQEKQRETDEVKSQRWKNKWPRAWWIISPPHLWRIEFRLCLTILRIYPLFGVLSLSVTIVLSLSLTLFSVPFATCRSLLFISWSPMASWNSSSMHTHTQINTSNVRNI